MIKKKMVILREEDFHPCGTDDIGIHEIGDPVDPMWGIEFITLRDEELQALLQGKCLWFTDGEYAHVLRAEVLS